MVHLILRPELKTAEIFRTEPGGLRTVKFLDNTSGSLRPDKLQQSAFKQPADVIMDIPRCFLQLLGYLLGGQGFCSQQMHNLDPQCTFQQLFLFGGHLQRPGLAGSLIFLIFIHL
ncbi:hypothetical protein D3C74_393200 [compost metagenome]